MQRADQASRAPAPAPPPPEPLLFLAKQGEIPNGRLPGSSEISQGPQHLLAAVWNTLLIWPIAAFQVLSP